MTCLNCLFVSLIFLPVLSIISKILFINTREKSPAFKLEYHLSISPGSHKTTNKPRLLSRGKNPKGFVIYAAFSNGLTGQSYCMSAGMMLRSIGVIIMERIAELLKALIC